MSLSEVISQLEDGESVTFTPELLAIRCVLKKTTDGGYFEFPFHVDKKELAVHRAYDVIAGELRYAMELLRSRSPDTPNSTDSSPRSTAQTPPPS